MRLQLGGRFYSTFLNFIAEYNSERIIKSGPRMPKL